ncbi:origin recognition complex subunit Orc5 [Hyaloscypha hepaticicola]|uniref:Origin recognition complex subunit Orc5 n=1 Tax=Hyaloscypha hepaticicola TaxID=2082293 RepID=A0A2J6PUJ2_9HELO|nr:origin recognition complex subunit Orc5 [Hyaloscypha hepaticicola]
MASLFSLPNELRITSLYSQFPCREQQIRALATLLSVRAAQSRNIILHGLEATGKSCITKAVLEELSTEHETANGIVNGNTAHENLRYAIVKTAECITGRHLLEQSVGAVAKAVEWKGPIGRCDNLSQLVVELSRLLANWKTSDEDGKRRFVLVFDGIDRQRDAPPTLLPALARLGEVIPSLTTLFLLTSPRPQLLHFPGVTHILFPSYTKSELLLISSLTLPNPLLPTGEKDTRETHTRFLSAVYDSLSKHSGRDILSFQHVAAQLWPRFIRPILSGELSPTPFSRLLLANRSLFQDDSVLIPSIISAPTSKPQVQAPTKAAKSHTLHQTLPFNSRLLLVSSYLASYNPPRLDAVLFMKTALQKRRKKGGATALTRTTKASASKSRKISRKLLGPQAFVLERMLAIFHAIREESRGGMGRGSVNGSADVQMAIATLISLRLLVRVGNADPLDGGARYRVAVGWEVVRSVGRSVGIEAEEWVGD